MIWDSEPKQNMNMDPENESLHVAEFKKKLESKVIPEFDGNPIDEIYRAVNEAKYGSRQHDVIAQAYNKGKAHGDTYCEFNIKKYITRYASNSNKSNNRKDLLKAMDYLQRMLEHSEDKPEVIEK